MINLLIRNTKYDLLKKKYVRHNHNDADLSKKIIQELKEKNVIGGSKNRLESVEVKKLSDGLTLIALDEHVPITTASLFVKAGSRYEDAKSSGSSHFLKRLAYYSTEKKYYLPLIRDIDVRGSEFGSVNTKEYVGYYVSGIRTSALNIFETLGSVFEPRLEEWEVRSVQKDIAEETTKSSQDPVNVLFENLHFEAFRDSPLANPINCPKHQLDVINNTSLRNYVNTHYQPNRMFVVANGISIEVLSRYASLFMDNVGVEESVHNVVGNSLDDFFPVLKKPSTVADKKSVYVGGGQVRIPGSGNTHIAISFEGVGETNIKDSLASSILKFVLGGGFTLQKGVQPGLGRSSRLGSKVHSVDWLLQANAFNLTYPETGLFGIYAESTRGNVPALVELINKEIQSLTKITDEEIESAKNQLKFSLLDTLANDRFALTEFLVSQVDVHGSAKTPAKYITEIDEITSENVRNFAQKLLSSKPVVSVVGDVEGLPRM